jgi:hypothetical protein
VKIAACYSHLNGYEFLRYHRPRLWDEIEASIAAVDAKDFRTKVSKEKTMVGAQLYSPSEINKAIRTELEERGWTSRHAPFWVTIDPKVIRRTLLLPPAEQKRVIAEAGLSAHYSYNQTDFVKDRVAVEVQLGKYFAVSYDLFVKHLAFFVQDFIDVGVEIVPMKSFSESSIGEDGRKARKMSTGVPWYEKELYNLIREGRGVPAVPLVLVGIEP